jgi:hypothetical protein
MTKKKMQVEFAPGAFDSFEGTQEELDALQAEILSMFNDLTPEELEARSQPVDDARLTELMEEDPEIFKHLTGNNHRPLQ